MLLEFHWQLKTENVHYVKANIPYDVLMTWMALIVDIQTFLQLLSITFSQFKPYVVLWYYEYYFIIPVGIHSKLKISFQVRKYMNQIQAKELYEFVIFDYSWCQMSQLLSCEPKSQNTWMKKIQNLSKFWIICEIEFLAWNEIFCLLLISPSYSSL